MRRRFYEFDVVDERCCYCACAHVIYGKYIYDQTEDAGRQSQSYQVETLITKALGKHSDHGTVRASVSPKIPSPKVTCKQI